MYGVTQRQEKQRAYQLVFRARRQWSRDLHPPFTLRRYRLRGNALAAAARAILRVQSTEGQRETIRRDFGAGVTAMDVLSRLP